MKIQCNGVVWETAIKANFGTFNVWYDDGAIANIVSLQQVAEKYPINFKVDDQGGYFTVSTKMGELNFLPHPKEASLLGHEKFVGSPVQGEDIWQ